MLDQSRQGPIAGATRPVAAPVAEVLAPLVTTLLGRDVPLRFEFWDGSVLSPAKDPVATLVFRSADAVRRIVWMPNELGLARAYVAGELELDGDIFATARVVRDANPGMRGAAAARAVPSVLDAARKVGAFGKPLAPPAEEARLEGWRHSVRRDSQAISHHYDVGNEFYGIVLGSSLTYSCARFVDPASTLEDAQAAKHELVCRKLGLHERPGARLLDVGCGWGSMSIHAANHHGARVVGITISTAQAESARRRVAEAGLGHLVEIRLQDYRDLRGERFDAISSVGMSEHVGHANLDRYFSGLRGVLAEEGRLLNHAISSPGGSKLGRKSFVGRYVFPDGELVDVGRVVLAMERAGFEVRDVESLREHYARTLRCWVANLEARWDRAVELAGLPRAKVWRLYMAGSAIAFELGSIAIHQVLGVAPSGGGASGMPATRHGWD